MADDETSEPALTPEPPDAPVWLSAEAAHGWAIGWARGFAAAERAASAELRAARAEVERLRLCAICDDLDPSVQVGLCYQHAADACGWAPFPS